jgi:hypothetical protein
MSKKNKLQRQIEAGDAALKLANGIINKQLHELRRLSAVAASAYQVLNLAMAEPSTSRIAYHMVHCATVALGTIEE